MNVNEFKLCYGCMQENHTQAGKCKHCGHINGGKISDCYLPEGSVIQNRYILGRVLGHGGFGITYIAYDTRIHAIVAIKEYLPGDFSIRVHNKPEVLVYDGEKKKQFQTGLEKFLDEAKTMAKYNHYKGVVTTIDFIQENNTAYIVMEYLDGETVESYLNRHEGFINYYDMLEIIYPVMESLIVLHQDGIIHRDISPDNIYMTKDQKIKLIDFGAARESDDEAKNYSIMLKPGYAPEEQYRSKGIQGPFTDVYAIAATMYKMLTGVTPVESMERVLGDKELVPLEEFNLKINKKQIMIINKALAVNSADRYQNVGEFKRALEKASTRRSRTLSLIKNIVLVAMISGIVTFVSAKIILDFYMVYIPDGISAYEAEVISYLEDEQISYHVTYAYDAKVPDKVVISQNIVDRRVQPSSVVKLVVCDKRLRVVEFSDPQLETYMKNLLDLDLILVKDIMMIETLDLSHLSLTSIGGLEYFESLKQLNLSHNNLLYADELGALSSLEVLDLSQNHILDTSFIETMTKIRQLNLSSNDLVSERLHIQSDSLNQLLLDNNYLRFLNNNIDASNLHVLSIRHNNLEDITDVETFTTLLQLQMSQNNLSDIEPMSSLENLVFLDLSHNAITKLSALTHLKKLKSLDLSYNNINRTDANLKIIGLDCTVVLEGE